MTSSIITQQIVIGTRVSCPFGGGREGVIYKITKPENKVYSIFEGMQIITHTYGVVFDNGTTNNALPSTILEKGHGWKILEGLASCEEIAELLELAEKTQREAREAQEQEKKAYEAQKVALAGVPELAQFLTQGDDKYSGKLAAANIRKELKRAFPSVKFSVRKPNYGAVYVSWTDGATVEAVEAITSKYQSGSFNSMEDIYENSPTPFNCIYGGADYIFTNRSFSDELISRAIDEVFEQYGTRVDGKKPTVADFRSGALFRHHELGDSFQRLISLQAHSISII